VTAPAENYPRLPLWRNPQVLKLLVIALIAEIGYAELNLSTMPVYLVADRHFGVAAVGLVLSSFLLAEALLKTPMGHLADRLGPRPLIMLGPLISVATSVTSLLIPHLGGTAIETVIFIGLRLFDGLALAMLWPAAFAEMNATVDDDQRQESMSLLNLCYMVGIALAFPVGGFVNDLSGHKWAGLVLAALMFVLVSVLTWFFIPARHDLVAHAAEAHSGGVADFVSSIKQIPEYLILSAVTFAGIGFPSLIVKLFPLQEFGLSETQVGIPIGIGALVLAAASVPMSKFGEKIGRTMAIHLGMGLSAFGMAFIGLGMFFPGLRHTAVLAAGALPVGIGFLLTIPAWFASVADLDKRRRGANIGAVMTAQGLGTIAGAPLGAALYDKLQPVGISLGLGAGFGRYAPFVGCAACLMIGFLLSLKILRGPADIDPDPGTNSDAPSPAPDPEPVLAGAAPTVLTSTDGELDGDEY
jgi:MFS family permease